MSKNKTKPIITLQNAVTLRAAAGESEGPPTFEVTAYNGGKMYLEGFDYPVVIDLAGMEIRRNIKAGLDHIDSHRVGHVTETTIDAGRLVLAGVASAATPYRDEVVNSAKMGYQWEASVEARSGRKKLIRQGRTVAINGQQLDGPFYHIETSELRGFGFVSQGADDNTEVSIAASAANQKGSKTMDTKLQTWIEKMLPGTEIDDLSAEAVANLEANYAGSQAAASKPAKPVRTDTLGEALDAKQAELTRVNTIQEIALNACDSRPFDIESIKTLAGQAVDEKWPVDKFRLELLTASIPPAGPIITGGGGSRSRVNGQVLEAAICTANRLVDVEKQYSDETLQTAHDHFRDGIGLRQAMLVAAESNGYRGGGSSQVTIETQRAAFGMQSPTDLRASGFSTLSLPEVFSNVANKFLASGWMSVDQTLMRLAGVRSVRDFKQVTTISLTGGMEFEPVGADGEIKHGQVGSETYNNQADTYGIMFSITRRDIINDDLGALTAVPRRIGRGGMLKLNDLFWTTFLNNSAFFAAGNSNVSTDTGALSSLGLSQAETIFAKQTDPDGKPLGEQSKILLVPTELKGTGSELMTSERIVTGEDATMPDRNIWNGRYQLESSPYMSNSSYTGYSAVAWYLLADPSSMPVIEIAALNGRVEPTVETADADFNVLGVQMRGYSDVGVALQEYRGGVRADGSAAG